MDQTSLVQYGLKAVSPPCAGRTPDTRRATETGTTSCPVVLRRTPRIRHLVKRPCSLANAFSQPPLSVSNRRFRKSDVGIVCWFDKSTPKKWKTSACRPMRKTGMLVEGSWRGEKRRRSPFLRRRWNENRPSKGRNCAKGSWQTGGLTYTRPCELAKTDRG